MRIAYYPTFRALDHPRSSGLVSIARDVIAAMEAGGHEVLLPLSRTTEWIFLRPGEWPGALVDAWKADRAVKRARPDCWFTYHTYYRGPDPFGPFIAARHRLPYFILAASYATKYRKRLKTWAGFHLNRMALERDAPVFVNKLRDVENLGRLLPPERISYIRPGIRTNNFPLEPQRGAATRSRLGLDGRLVVVTAAMFRPGVKEDGVAFVLDACAALKPEFPELHLLVLGDGAGRGRLEERARRALPGAHTFAGRIAPQDMHAFYQAGDLFAFPGIGEALGMVYLEAQCCGLPVVATSHDGAPEVVADGEAGIIVPPFDPDAFAEAVGALLRDSQRRGRLGRQARERVLRIHDIAANYREMLAVMERVCAGRRP
jgi:glycosyltransferase involved in cell wall biosynthesis